MKVVFSVVHSGGDKVILAHCWTPNIVKEAVILCGKVKLKVISDGFFVCFCFIDLVKYHFVQL